MAPQRIAEKYGRLLAVRVSTVSMSISVAMAESPSLWLRFSVLARIPAWRSNSAPQLLARFLRGVAGVLHRLVDVLARFFRGAVGFTAGEAEREGRGEDDSGDPMQPFHSAHSFACGSSPIPFGKSARRRDSASFLPGVLALSAGADHHADGEADRHRHADRDQRMLLDIVRHLLGQLARALARHAPGLAQPLLGRAPVIRSEEHTSELQSRENIV